MGLESQECGKCDRVVGLHVREAWLFEELIVARSIRIMERSWVVGQPPRFVTIGVRETE